MAVKVAAKMVRNPPPKERWSEAEVSQHGDEDVAALLGMQGRKSFLTKRRCANFEAHGHGEVQEPAQAQLDGGPGKRRRLDRGARCADEPGADQGSQ